jgi:hypothetical protein
MSNLAEIFRLANNRARHTRNTKQTPDFGYNLSGASMSAKAEEEFPRDAAADLWRRTLAQIPNSFARLVYLASLRDVNTGRYQHHGLSQVFGGELADHTLRQAHLRIFAEWLGGNLERQKTDLEEYLSTLDGPVARVLDNWLRLAPFAHFLPAETREVERQLYLSDLHTLLELLRREHAVASPDPEA